MFAHLIINLEQMEIKVQLFLLSLDTVLVTYCSITDYSKFSS